MRPRKALRQALAIAVVAVIAGACAAASTPVATSTPSTAVASSSPTTEPSPTDTQPSPDQIASPSADPSPTPVPIPALTQTFRSPTMGYSVRYPKGWTVFEASEPWKPGADDFWDDPNGDRIESADAGFRGGSQPLEPGQIAKAWVDEYAATWPTGCGVREQIPLGGSEATIGLNGCDGLGRLGGRVFDLVVVVGRRAYNFTMEGHVDHAFLLAMLATIKFTPANATR